ncbi:MAG: flagellar basal body-associated FliL family protein [Rhodospirillales bacterium]|nr:flagellar basal body-associated FliL family protein [Alphaproteobacteria bacterium]MBL6948579.1 flagellar basal body-associated FliL family protein [Rhodospirillales bacterium]
MADEDEEEQEVSDDLEDEDEEEGIPHEGVSKKKLVLILLLVTLMLVSIILGGLYFVGILDPLLGIDKESEKKDAALIKGQHYFKLEDMTVNLVSGGKKSRFFKVSVTVAVIQEADVSVIEALAPRITDYVTQYLRELKPEEMAGSANFYRMHENVLLRVRAAVAPIVVTDVLITSALVQ